MQNAAGNSEKLEKGKSLTVGPHFQHRPCGNSGIPVVMAAMRSWPPRASPRSLAALEA